MTVWVFNTPQGDGKVDFVYSSLQKGISRYGWSYLNTADLRKMENKDWDELDKNEIECWNRGHFLLEIEKGDWVVHVNVPEWGFCTAGKVIETYKFDSKKNKIGVDDYSDGGDFRHTLGIDIETLIKFDRNNENITPFISRRLKLQGAHWKIYETDEFLQSIENVRNNAVSLPENITHGLYYLRKDLKMPLSQITAAIQKNHPGKKLEDFIAMIFQKIPNVIDVKKNGSGWGTDYGADIIVTYSIISTAEASNELLKSIEKAQKKIKKPIALIAGEDVAMFVLKYGAEYIF